MTREQWLHAGTDLLRPKFQGIEAPLPATIHTSIGFPSRNALSRSRRVIGQCWNGMSSSDGNSHVFISPVLIEPVDILDTLAHELVHVVTPGAGHKGKFINVAKALGLTAGKPTSAGAGPELRAELEAIAHKLGPMPHSGLSAINPDRTPQSTRMIKCECPECGYTVRTTRKWLEVAEPICPVDQSTMTIDRLNGGGE